MESSQTRDPTCQLQIGFSQGNFLVFFFFFFFFFFPTCWPALLASANLSLTHIKTIELGFLGCSVVKNLPANARDVGSIPDLGRTHMPRSNLVCCSVAQLCLTLCNPMDCGTPGFHALYYLLEFAQTHGHWVDDAIQPSHPLSPPSPPAFSLSPHQGLFQWVGFSHQVTKVLELQLQHQSFQWIFRVDFV